MLKIRVFKGATMENGFWLLVMYAVGAAAIFSGLIHSYTILAGALTLFLAWDIIYLRSEAAFAGRDVSAINDGVTRARTYISWFIGLYGVLFGLVFTSNADARALFQTAMMASNTPYWMIALPLALALLSMLFIPIQLKDHAPEGHDEPNSALKYLFVFVVQMQKIILILIGHIGFRIFSAW